MVCIVVPVPIFSVKHWGTPPQCFVSVPQWTSEESTPFLRAHAHAEKLLVLGDLANQVSLLAEDYMLSPVKLN